MKASANAAVTVVNAMATGNGSAVGIDLEVTSEVEIVEKGVKGEIRVRGDRYENFELIRCVKEVVEDKLGEDFGIEFIVDSEIPIGKGLKSSSAVSNALVKAIVRSLDVKLDDREMIDMGIEASEKAGVTLTGALDDAYASYFGGLCFTDNLEGKVLKSEKIKEEPVFLLIPEETVLTNELIDIDFEDISPYIDLVFDSAVNDHWREASFLNGLIYSAFFGYDLEPILEVLEFSETVGLSGKGPAVYSMSEESEKIKRNWASKGEILEVSTI